MNFYLTVGAVAIFFVIALLWFLYRIYKRLGRRCTIKNCGCTLKRVHKMLHANDESISFRSPQGGRRWWIRRIFKVTFTRCPRHGYRCVKVDRDPISMWHALWAKKFHPEQFIWDGEEEDQDLDKGMPNLTQAYREWVRILHLGSRYEDLDSGSSDTPPISLDTLFQGIFDEISDIIGND